MTKAYLGLGSNMGDKKNYLDQAIRLINQHTTTEVIQTSSYYETDPVGFTDQDKFLNVVVEVNTDLQPYKLLEYCNGVEDELQRRRLIRWGPRTIDIDLLLYEDFELTDERLTIPHPRMTERAFVMVPLYEIAKEISINGKAIEEIMENISLKGITKLELQE